MWMWCVFTKTSFLPYTVWCNLNSSADGWSSWRRCLAVFPRHKGKTKLISILPFGQLLVALIVNRWIGRNAIIPQLGGWLQLYSLSFFFFFFFLSQGSLKITHLSNDCRSGMFLYLTTFFLFEQDNFFTKRDLPPHRHFLVYTNHFPNRNSICT